MKIRRKKQNKKEWHKRFAWLPTKVDDTEKDYGVVWFEQYFRKEGFQKGTWIKHSKGEWMRKKLKGDFDKPTAEFTFTGAASTSTITLNDLNTTTFIDSGQVLYYIDGEEKSEEEDLQEEFDFENEKKQQQQDPRHNQW